MTPHLSEFTRACTGFNCDAQIIDVVLVRQDGVRSRHVFDPEPVDGGKYRIELNLLGEYEAHHDGSLTNGHVSHFATCVDAQLFRDRSGFRPPL